MPTLHAKLPGMVGNPPCLPRDVGGKRVRRTESIEAKMVIPLSVRTSDDPRTGIERRSAMTSAQRLKRMFNIDIRMIK